MKKFRNHFVRIYHKILNLFFDFDIGIYALSTPKIPTTRIFDYEPEKEIPTNKLECENFNCNTVQLKPPVVIFYKAPSLKDKLKIKDYTQKLHQNLKIREEKLNFQFVPRKYEASIKEIPEIFETNLILDAEIKKASKSDIHISQSVKTIEELLELEPYTHKYPVKKVLEIPVVKYAIKKEKFTEEQIDLMRTKLAQQAKCKKYSINVENIYDKLPEDLYEEIKLEKDATLKCKYSKKPHAGELQLLITGKRKYDTQTTKAYVKYSEVGI